MDYPWAFSFTVQVLENLGVGQKFTDSFFCDALERQSAYNAQPYEH